MQMCILLLIIGQINDDADESSVGWHWSLGGDVGKLTIGVHGDSLIVHS